jgi:site-specific recombinase XerD
MPTPAPAPANPAAILAAVPQESVWLANFVSKRTRETYRNAIREFLAFLGIKSADELAAVDQAHVIAWREDMARRGAEAKTIHNRISAVSSLFKHLCEHQEAKRNPTTGVKRPRVDSSQVKTPVITPEQVRKVLDSPAHGTLRGLRDRAILHILFYTGCRISEVARLRVRDIREDGGYTVLDFIVKGGKRNRLAIHPELQKMLKEYLDISGHGRMPDYALILTTRKRPGKRLPEPMSREQMYNLFMKYAKAAGLPADVTPHTARATFITQALEKNCPIEAVKRSVGHSRISTTQMYDKRTAKHRESASFAVAY